MRLNARATTVALIAATAAIGTVLLPITYVAHPAFAAAGGNGGGNGGGNAMATVAAKEMESATAAGRAPLTRAGRLETTRVAKAKVTATARTLRRWAA